MHYADTSALVKLVVPEPETAALRAWIGSARVELAASDLVRAELIRAVRRSDADPGAAARARDLLARLTLLPATADIMDRAALLDPVSLCSLDAVHLASALLLGDSLESVVTYDERLAEAARVAGLSVAAPGADRPRG